MATKEQWQGATIEFDVATAVEVFDLMLRALEHNIYPFTLAATQLPQRQQNLPEELIWHSRDHAMFLFILCLWMRGGILSDVAGKQIGKLYVRHPEWFDPFWAQHQSPEDLKPLLKEVGLGLRTNAKHWVENCKRLVRHFDGDPIKILHGVTSYGEACARIQNRRGLGFVGFQEKMTSMLIYFFMDSKFPELEEYVFPVPIDIHVFRIVLAHEIVKVTGQPAGENLYTEAVLEPLRTFFVDYCNELGVSPLRLSDALWMWSRTLCSMSPTNSVKVGPRKGRQTVITPIPINWTPKQLNAFHRSCGSCLIASTCKYNVPSQYHYIQGNTHPRGERDLSGLLFQPSISFEDAARIELNPKPITPAKSISDHSLQRVLFEP